MMILKLIVINFVILLVSYPLYLWMTYIDESVYSGSAYGLHIGASKREVYDAIPLALYKLKGHGDSVFIQIKSSEKTAAILAAKVGSGVMIKPLFDEVGFDSFAKKDSWRFYINASFFNTLKLDFCDEKLCKIRRHRKYFELP